MQPVSRDVGSPEPRNYLEHCLSGFGGGFCEKRMPQKKFRQEPANTEMIFKKVIGERDEGRQFSRTATIVSTVATLTMADWRMSTTTTLTVTGATGRSVLWKSLNKRRQRFACPFA